MKTFWLTLAGVLLFASLVFAGEASASHCSLSNAQENDLEQQVRDWFPDDVIDRIALAGSCGGPGHPYNVRVRTKPDVGLGASFYLLTESSPSEVLSDGERKINIICVLVRSPHRGERLTLHSCRETVGQ